MARLGFVIVLAVISILLVACLYTKIARREIIPKIIHQTHALPFHALPVRMKNAIDSWRHMNPEYEHRYYSDFQMDQICMTSTYPQLSQAYAQLQRIHPSKGAMRADLFRLLIMYKHGGVYVDVDVTPKRPLRTIIQESDEFVSGIGQRKDLHQWIIIACPKHPFIKVALNAVIQSALRGTTDKRLTGYGVEGLTGPPIYNIAIQDHTSNKLIMTPGSHTCAGVRYRLLDGDYLGNTMTFKYDGYGDDLKTLGLRHWSAAP